MPVDSLTNLPGGRDVLLDANVFVYAFRGQSPECLSLLRRCAQEEVTGITTVEIINEVCHKLMLAEALGRSIITRQTAQALNGRHDEIKRLAEYWTQTARIFELNILILSLEEARIRRAQQMRMLHGLLTNDSVILAAADEYGIDCLASRDGDFDQVPWLTIYKPTDL